MKDFFNESSELERLAGEYDSKFGPGKADEILGALMIAYSIQDQIKIFKKANGKEIIVKEDKKAIDSIMVTYK